MADYEPTKWWKVLDPEGGLWCETSSEKEARGCMRPGDTLLRMHQKIEYKWEIVEPDEKTPDVVKEEDSKPDAMVLIQRLMTGCAACGRKWTTPDIEAHFPLRGMVCSACYDG